MAINVIPRGNKSQETRILGRWRSRYDLNLNRCWQLQIWNPEIVRLCTNTAHSLTSAVTVEGPQLFQCFPPAVPFLGAIDVISRPFPVETEVVLVQP